MGDEGQMSLQVAEKLIYEWYHDIKTDQLASEELIFELAIRSILIRDDPTFVRRKRAVRDHLKIEKEQKKKVIPPSGMDEIDVDHEKCEIKFVEIAELIKSTEVPQVLARCKTRLLHLGHRLLILLKHTQKNPEQILAMQQMFVDVVQTLKKHFYASDTTSIPESQPPGIEELFEEENLNPPPGNHLVKKTSQVSLCKEDIEWIRSLDTRLCDLESKLGCLSLIRGFHSRLSDLETKLESLAENQEVITRLSDVEAMVETLVQQQFNNQTSVEKLTPIFAKPSNSNSNNNGNSQSSSNPQPNQPNFNQPNQPNLNQANFNLHSQLTNFPSHNYNNPNFNSSNFNSAYSQPPFNNQNNVPSWFNPVPDPVPNFNPPPNFGNSNNQPNWGIFGQPPWLAPQGSNSNAFANPFNQNFKNNRHTLPVSKWSITKYDGEDQGLTLNEFLEIVKAVAQAEHVTETELFESAVHLFTGSALKWYMTMRSSNRLTCWQHLVWELRKTFMHPDLDSLIKTKIYQRRQMRNESFQDYYHEMERLFRTMSEQISDFEKVQVLKNNMRIDYKKQINFQPLETIAQLTLAGQKVDALYYPAYNKVFGSEKTVNMVSSSEPKQKPAKKETTKPPQSPPKTSHPPNPPRNNNNNNNFSNNNRNQSQSTQQTAATSGSNLRSQNGPVSQLEGLINNHRPPARNQCFNCGNFGHSMPNCPLPKGVLCENCGFRGYPTNNCPFCIKNDFAANQNRRPLN